MIAGKLREGMSGLRAERWSRVALGGYLLLALAGAVKPLVVPNKHTVFPKFIAGAERACAGQPLYAAYEGYGAFRYSPTFAFLMTPFALLGPRVGGAVWALLGVTAYYLALRQAGRAWFERDPSGQAAFLLLALPLAVRGVWNGQSNILVAATLLAGAVAVGRSGLWRAAGLLALSVVLKLSPVAVAMLIALAAPRRLLPRLLIALIVAGLVPFLFAAPRVAIGQYSDWVAHWSESAAARWPGFRDGWTLWEQFAPPDLRVYRLVQVGTALALAGVAWRTTRGRPAAAASRWLLAIGTTWLMLLGPAVEYNTYVLLAPALAWGLIDAWRRRAGHIGATTAALFCTVLGAGASERALLGLLPGVRAALPVGAILFLLWLIIHGRPKEARPADECPQAS